ncbi:MAG: hypothetical protein QOJ25_2627 [Solirubrobacteraceae bacterium]|jgi:hypothetical protein|nr:hypothetical protein [Solirubrobacteraceae bacterium]
MIGEDNMLDRLLGGSWAIARSVPALVRDVLSVAMPDRGAGPPRAPAVAVHGTIDDVIARMTALGKRFERDYGSSDGVLWFNRLYLAVTKGVKRAVEQPGFFHDPRALARLDVIFAQLYFDAVDAVDRGERPAAWGWRLLFESRARAGVLPIQFAVAGMNAHINHDLPIALLEQWELARRRPDTPSPAYSDFGTVNQILKREERRLKSRLEPAELREIDRGSISRLDDRLGLWVVEQARDRAWHAADVLWDVRHLPPVRAAWEWTIDGSVGALGETLIQPL